jgi:hypothetical protein
VTEECLGHGLPIDILTCLTYTLASKTYNHLDIHLSQSSIHRHTILSITMSTTDSQAQGEMCRCKELYDDQSIPQIAWIKEHYSRAQTEKDARLEQERTELDLSIAQWVPGPARHDSVLDTPPTIPPNPFLARRTAVTADLNALRHGVFQEITTTHQGRERGCPRKTSDSQSQLSTAGGSIEPGPSTAPPNHEADRSIGQQ